MTRDEAYGRVLSHMGLIYRVAHDVGDISPGFGWEDNAQEMFLNAVHAFERYYNPERGTETTFLGCVLWRSVSRCRAAYGTPTEITVDELEIEQNTSRVSAVDYFQRLFRELVDRLRAHNQDLVRVLLAALKNDGNMTATARSLKISRQVLYGKIREIRRSPVGADIAAAF